MSKNPPASITLPTSPLRVSVISGDPLARAGLESALSTAEGVELTDDNPDEAIIDAGSDAEAPDLSGLAAIDVPAVVLIGDEGHASRALAAGARGVLIRDHIDASLVAALAAAKQGLTVVDRSLANVPALPRQVNTDPLTNREREVLGLMAEGLSNKLIAAKLGISEHTAKFHIGSILDKLDADTRTGAVVTGLRLGLVAL